VNYHPTRLRARHISQRSDPWKRMTIHVKQRSWYCTRCGKSHDRNLAHCSSITTVCFAAFSLPPPSLQSSLWSIRIPPQRLIVQTPVTFTYRLYPAFPLLSPVSATNSIAAGRRVQQSQIPFRTAVQSPCILRSNLVRTLVDW
jgi:hypothetical protein